MPYDVVIAGGELLDSVTGQATRTDVGFSSGTVSTLANRLGHADTVIDARDCLVVPGLIDIHAHVFPGFGLGADPDQSCLAHGTTTAVDGGTAGSMTLAALRRLVESARTRVLFWLNLSTIGIIDTRVGELVPAPYIDVERAVDVAQEHRDVVVGIKARLSTYAAGGGDLNVLNAAVQVGERCGLPVMVHVGDTESPLTELVSRLRPGDVVTHAFTGRRHGILTAAGRVAKEVLDAQRCGVRFDLGRGRPHLSFRVLRLAVEQGFLPDTISTDLSAPLTKISPDVNLPTIATYLLTLGVSIPEAVKRMTSNAAAVIGRPELGRVDPGGAGDVTVLRLETGLFSLLDSDGAILESSSRLRSVAVVRHGALVNATPA